MEYRQTKTGILVNVIKPPRNHSGYVVIQDDKIIGPRYRYYETAWENVGYGIVTSFDLAKKISTHNVHC